MYGLAAFFPQCPVWRLWKLAARRAGNLPLLAEGSSRCGPDEVSRSSPSAGIGWPASNPVPASYHSMTAAFCLRGAVPGLPFGTRRASLPAFRTHVAWKA